MLIKNPNYVNAPPGRAACDAALGRFVSPSSLGFVCEAGDLNRFCSRYRLARSFKEILLDSYTIETVAGYSALFHVFLVWSAFEQFMDICGQTLDGIEPSLTPYGPSSVVVALQGIEGHDSFLKFVRDRLDHQKHRSQVETYLAGQPCNPLYLPAGIRHIFAHGILTPNSGVGTTTTAQQISKVLCDFLFRVMDGEFLAKLRMHGLAV